MRMGRLLVSIGWDIGPLVFLAYVVVNITTFVGPFLFALGLRPLVNGIFEHSNGSAALGAAMCSVALLLAVASPAAYRWTTIRLRERSIMVMQRRLLILSTSAPSLDHFERPQFFDRLQLLKRSSYELVMGMTIATVGPVILVQLVATSIVLARLQPLLLLLPFIAVPATWIHQRAEKMRRAGEERAAPKRRNAEHLFILSASAPSAMEIRIYDLRDELLRRHRDAGAAAQHEMETALFRSVALSASGWLLFAASYVGSVLLVLRGAGTGRVTPGDVALTMGMATAMVTAAGRLTELAGSAMRAATAADHYHWLEQQVTAPFGRHVDGARLPVPSRLTRGLELDGVTFSYGDGDRPALDDVTLRLDAGRVVAVVGENGAGKTTLVKLLCRMYAPTRGRVLVDGVDLDDLDPAEYRRRVTAGFQDYMRFELLARETVGVGDAPRLAEVGAVQSALTKANGEFVERLPDGIETQLGRSWGGGVELSGGEWQKLALARTMMRDDPFLVVFDEPTASLDPQTEHALFEQVASDMRSAAANGRITLLISHRFSTVRMADVIVVLDRGRVVDQGTHDELMARAGLYAELYTLQARAYL